jgi:hypothetical protein
MDLIHHDVNVKMVFVVVRGNEVLMFGEPQFSERLLCCELPLFSRWRFTWLCPLLHA